MENTVNQLSNLEIYNMYANIVIAVLALLFSIYIYYITKKNENNKNNKDRENESFNVFIIQHNLKSLFIFYDDILSIMKPLEMNKLTDDEKQLINDKLQDSLKSLRFGFIDLFLAIDKNLYDNMKNITDSVVDELTNEMFDEGINLNNTQKFEDEIISRISQSKTETIKKLYDFNRS